MKPEHFRELEPDQNCFECRHKKFLFPADTLPVATCMKHDFELPGATSKVLSSFVCQDFERYPEES